jgi:putative FmdB family regulatory protein
MPIYAYRCGSCGHAKDVLQKISDAPLTTCPACGAEAFSKQLTAAGFQLKGTGWYTTDFSGRKAPAETPAGAGDAPAAAGAPASASAPDATKTEAASAASPAPPASAAAPSAA